MCAPSSPDCAKGRDKRRNWICVLLIGLLLYNPFLALTSVSHGLAYHELARHRASVGASEMQHFAPVQIENASPDVGVAARMGELLAPQEEAVSLHNGQEHLLLLLEGMTSLWFRPPPRA